jgi:hypothetical protein
MFFGGDVMTGRGIKNVQSITAAHIDCCCLANNHVLDREYPGLV